MNTCQVEPQFGMHRKQFGAHAPFLEAGNKNGVAGRAGRWGDEHSGYGIFNSLSNNRIERAFARAQQQTEAKLVKDTYSKAEVHEIANEALVSAANNIEKYHRGRA